MDRVHYAYPRLKRCGVGLVSPIRSHDRLPLLCHCPAHITERVRKVIRLMERFPDIWSVGHASLAEKLEIFHRYRLLLRDLTFEEALAVERDGYRPGDDLVGAYQDDILSRLGIVHSEDQWIVRERGWQAGPDVTILVTKAMKR